MAKTAPDPFTPAEIRNYYASRAPQVRQTGSEWRGPCPIHQGSRDSFTVNPSTGLWTCHSQCGRGGSMFDFEMSITGLDFKRAASEVCDVVGRPRGGRRAGELGQITATYDYVDESGTLLFQCVRYDHPKDFRQRRPDGHGDWVWKLEGVRRVLYRLPKVITAPMVAVVEGEKDVHALEALGFTATCNPMGAGKNNWRAEYSDTLRGKDVVVFPDNDTPGREHADRVARSLSGKARSTKVVTVESGKDVSDWIASGATRETIEEAINNAKPAPPAVVEMPKQRPAASARTWRENLILSPTDMPRAILANALVPLRLAPEWAGVLRFDSFAMRMTVGATPPWGSPQPGAQWTDQETRLLTEWLQRQGIFVNTETAGQAAQTVAMEHSFNPVHEYLNGLKWDGVNRIDHLADLYFGAEHSPYTVAVSGRFLISAAARALSPVAVKVDCVLVLEGRQGTLKSTAVAALFSPWFTDHLPPLESKDVYLQLMGTWCVELAELDAIRKAEVTKVKSFLSSASDKLRMPYGRIAIDVPRHNVFVGTTNKTEWQLDETGGRRFWPIQCGTVRLEEVRRDRDMLWAEAVARYRAGEHWWLDTPELNRMAEAEVAERFEPGHWDERIVPWLEGREFVSIVEVLEHCIGRPVNQQTQADQNTVARCLAHQGWQRYRQRVGEWKDRNLEWRYRKVEP